MEKFELVLNDENIKNSIKNDYIDNNRKIYSLLRLIDKIDESATICVDGAWGVGKTFFVSQLIYLINNIDCNGEISLDEEKKKILNNIHDKNILVYYDTWKNDNHIDPFESIIFNILNEFPKYKKVVPEFHVVKDVLLKFGKNFLEKSTFDIVKFDDISTYEDLASQIVTMEEKQKQFKELINKILGNKRLILFIDELDRCNPLYASKILETIKHFYDLPNITVVVANNSELCNTIKKQYGYQFDAYSYLNKFYDFVITLDNSKKIEYAKRILKFRSDTYLPHNVAFEMFNKYNFSYRDCNRYRTMYNIVEHHIETSKSNIFENENEYLIAFKVIIPIIIAFKVKDLEAYKSVINGNEEEIGKALKYVNEQFQKNEDININWLKQLVKCDDGKEIETILDIYRKFKKTSMHKNIFDDCIRMSI